LKVCERIGIIVIAATIDAGRGGLLGVLAKELHDVAMERVPF